ncbi:MAG: diacylglycerol kinase family protein [Deltaproteobacteria bacterium]|nr:diacylglycerol kinase family protein [Deltaproteobacteria bacterium]
MNFNKILIIYNPKSGRFSEKKLSYILNFFKYRNILTDTLNIIENCIERESIVNFYDMVLVAGGDGSLNYVINNLVFTDIPIAHLPMGTVNLFALENRTSYLLGKALNEIIHEYKPVKINIGKANDRFFFAMTGIGLDAFIVKSMEEKIRKNKKRIYNNFIKYAGYIFNIIKLSKNYKFCDLSLEIAGDGGRAENGKEQAEIYVKHDAKEIIVSNIRYYGGPFEVFPGNSPLNEKFHIRLVKNAAGRMDVIFSILKSLTFYRRYSDNPDFYVKADRMIISSSNPSENKYIFYQCDGEFAGTLPVKIEKVKNAITMLVNPASFL